MIKWLACVMRPIYFITKVTLWSVASMPQSTLFWRYHFFSISSIYIFLTDYLQMCNRLSESSFSLRFFSYTLTVSYDIIIFLSIIGHCTSSPWLSIISIPPRLPPRTEVIQVGKMYQKTNYI